MLADPMPAAPETQRFVLSPSVEILSVREFPEAIRDRLGGNDDDYVISDRTARIGSQLIGRDAALLLRRFRDPIRIVDAVFEYGTERGIDPHQLLADVYPFIRTMCLSSILIPPDAVARSEASKPMRGDTLGEFEILDVARRVGDTDLLKARSSRGDVVAVKRVSMGAAADVRDNLRREASVLEFGRAAHCRAMPGLLGHDLDRDDPYIVLEWLSGQTLFDFLRAQTSTMSPRISLVRSLVACYRDLHDHGIYHGDVHPNNVMVAGDGSVRLLDFGGARLADQAFDGDRIGLVQFYEPEVASAILAHQQPPEPTAAGEQYGVAGLAFATLTGNYPIALSLMTETALKQIVSVLPRRFTELGLRWPEVEAVLLRALSKQPRDRFTSMGAFEFALVEAFGANTMVSVVRSSERLPAPKPARGHLDDAASNILADYGLRSRAPLGFDRGPKASIYAGGAGVALALLRIACVTGDAASLAAAELWVRWAKSVAGDPLAFTDGSIGESVKTGELSLFQSMTGVHTLDALVEYALGDNERSHEAIDAFIAAVAPANGALSAFPMDATNGAASLLLGAALLVPIAANDQMAQLRSLGRRLAVIAAGQFTTTASHNAYLGFAHGRAGALFAQLRWAEASGETPPSTVAAHLDWMAAHAVRLRGSSAWPIALDDPSQAAWTGWCHGSAGHLLLWSLASRVLCRDAYLENALRAGTDIWRRRGSSGPSLCCGGAGETLALYELARASGSDTWVDRGRRLATQAASAAAGLARSQGLFRSGLGVALAAAESAEPQNAVWPVLQSPL